MKNMTKGIFLLLPALFLSVFMLAGCATTRNMQGKPIASANVNNIINGQTTESQIINMFGPPYAIEKSVVRPGVTTYKYRFYYHKYVHLGNEILTSSTRKYEEKLDVVIENGIVTGSSFSTHGNTSLKDILKEQKIHE